MMGHYLELIPWAKANERVIRERHTMNIAHVRSL